MSEKRNKYIKIRVTESELLELRARSAKPRLAEWMREHCLDVEQRKRRPVPTVAPDLLRQLKALGNNLNQIARQVNQSGITPADRLQIISAMSAIENEMRKIREQNDRKNSQ